MLPGEDFCGRHQGALGAGGCGVGQGQHCDHSLARSHIPLEQAAHALTGGQVGPDLVQRRGLVQGQPEGQGGLDPPGEVRRGQGPGGAGPAMSAPLGHGQLVGEKLIVGESASRW